MIRLWQLQMKFRHLLDRLGIKKIKRNVVRGAFTTLLRPGLMRDFHLSYRTGVTETKLGALPKKKREPWPSDLREKWWEK